MKMENIDTSQENDKNNGNNYGDEEIKTPRVAPFLRSLMNILDVEDTRVIRWSDDGLSFEIVDIDAMSTKILPKYFRHKKFASFQRQLNYFGFKKISKTKTAYCTYSRQHFTRDDRENLMMIRRKTTTEKRRGISDVEDDQTSKPSCGIKRPFVDTNPLSPHATRSATRAKVLISMSPVFRANSKKVSDPYELDIASCDLLESECDLSMIKTEPEPGDFVNDDEWIEDVDYLTKSGGSTRLNQKSDEYQSTLCNQVYNDEFLGRWLFPDQELDCVLNMGQCTPVA